MLYTIMTKNKSHSLITAKLLEHKKAPADKNLPTLIIIIHQKISLFCRGSFRDDNAGQE